MLGRRIARVARVTRVPATRVAQRSVYDAIAGADASWKELFARNPKSLKEPAPSSIEATVDEPFNTADHPFLEDPLMCLLHRIRGEIMEDPRLQAYMDYLQEMDPTASEAKRAQVEKFAPPPNALTPEEAAAEYDRRFGLQLDHDPKIAEALAGKDYMKATLK